MSKKGKQQIAIQSFIDEYNPDAISGSKAVELLKLADVSSISNEVQIVSIGNFRGTWEVLWIRSIKKSPMKKSRGSSLYRALEQFECDLKDAGITNFTF